MVSPKTLEIIVVITVVVAGLGLLFVHSCAYGSGMGAAYRTCQCRGYEWELYDRTPADGPRKTLCIGMVESTTCHQFMGGPEIPCGQ